MNLHDFANKEHPALAGPFSDGEHSYATDGILIVRIPLDPTITAPVPEMVQPYLHGSGSLFTPEKTYIDLPDYALPDKVKCNKCKGIGKVSLCEECEGEGTVFLNNAFNEYVCECESCAGYGTNPKVIPTVICEDCNGEGSSYEESWPHVDLGDVRLGIIELEKMKRLPGLKINVSPLFEQAHVHFIFDGGDGALMTVNKEDDE